MPREFGPDGWVLDHKSRPMRVIVTCGGSLPVDVDSQGREWWHASISHKDRMPTYSELAALHLAVWGRDGWAYQVFAPRADHVNIHSFALHLWGLPDGRAALPNFGFLGSI